MMVAQIVFFCCCCPYFIYPQSSTLIDILQTSIDSTGVDAIRAPISVTAEFKEPLLVPGKVTIKFCESAGVQSKCVSFQMEQYERKILHITGQICRTTVEDVN